MAKLAFNRLFRAAELPALHEAVAEMQRDSQEPGPEIVAEQAWDTLGGEPWVLVSLLTHSSAQAFELGWLWATKQKGGQADD